LGIAFSLGGVDPPHQTDPAAKVFFIDPEPAGAPSQDMAAEFSIPICDYFNASWWQSGASGEVHGDGEEFKSGVRGTFRDKPAAVSR
jgi:hypothetical protein